VIAILERLPADVAQEVRQIELLGMARSDPLEAIRYAEALPPGPERSRALELAARGYVLTDPVAALAWVQSVRPPEPGLVAAALTGYARVDPDRAVDLLLAEASGRRAELARSLVTTGALDAEHVAALLSRWPDTTMGRTELRGLLGGWARRDPERAVEWLIANDQRGSDAYAYAAEALGKKDPAAAAAYARRIPAELRSTWIKSAAGGYAGEDPQRAAAWAAQYASEPGYEAAVAAIAQRAARSDPKAAAALLGTLESDGTAEGRAAASVIARRWSSLDSPAARQWALSLRAGDTRDAALAPVLGAALVARGDVDPVLLGAFSSNAAQQSALGDAVVALARRDPAAARSFADRYLTDPDERRTAERLIGER